MHENIINVSEKLENCDSKWLDELLQGLKEQDSITTTDAEDEREFYVDLDRACILCDVWEWKVTDDFKGYTKVGKQTFIVRCTSKMDKLGTEKIIQRWNDSHNKHGESILYEAIEVSVYCNFDKDPSYNYHGKDGMASFKKDKFEIHHETLNA
jgi:hypothetical protein